MLSYQQRNREKKEEAWSFPINLNSLMIEQFNVVDWKKEE